LTPYRERPSHQPLFGLNLTFCNHVHPLFKAWQAFLVVAFLSC